MRFCQFRVNTSKNDMVRVLGPRQFIEGGKLWEQGHICGAKSHVSQILKIMNFGELRSLRALVWIFSALPGAVR